MNNSHESRRYQGPARLLQEGMIDQATLNNTKGMGSESRRDMLNNTYGPEGTGWEVVGTQKGYFEMTPEERKDREIGRELLKIVVTPDGDNFSRVAGDSRTHFRAS